MRQVIVLHQGALGDFLLALSVIQSIRAATRAERVIVIASAASAQLAAGRSAVDAYLSPEDTALHTLFAETQLDSLLGAALADASHVVSFLCAPDEPLHDRLRRATNGQVISLDPRPTRETIIQRQHITAQWINAIRAQGLPITDATPANICVSPGGWASRLPAIAQGVHHAEAPTPAKQRILMHPGSGGRAKCWPLERFIDLADALQPATIHWLLGPAELETAPERFAPLRARTAARGESLLIEPDLLRAAEHMTRMSLYIGNDAGTTHLAAALGVPTLAIFGPTDPSVWRPLSTHVHVVAPPAPTDIAAVTVEAARAQATPLCAPPPPKTA